MKSIGWAMVMGCGLVSMASAAERVIQHSAVVNASVQDVYADWTTVEGVTSFAPPKATIDFRVGGAYEWYFLPDAPEGGRGGEGCKVVSYIPNHMVSFSWNAPPSIPKLRESGAKTQVVVWFDDIAPGQTQVSLHQFITEEGEDWDKYHAYFTRAWGNVLKAQQEKYVSPAGTTEAGATTQGIDSLGRFVGEWLAEGTWEDPKKGGIRVAYEWGVGNKAVHSKSFIVNEGKEQLVYETTFYWHPGKKQLVFQSISAAGGLFDGVAKVSEADTIECQWYDYSADSTREWKQTLRFLDTDTYEWKVHQKKGKEWVPAKEGTFRRKK